MYVREEGEKETKQVYYFYERLVVEKKIVLVVADLRPASGRKGESIRVKGEKYCHWHIGYEHHVLCKEYMMIKLSSTLCHSVEVFLFKTATF